METENITDVRKIAEMHKNCFELDRKKKKKKDLEPVSKGLKKRFAQNEDTTLKHNMNERFDVLWQTCE